MITEVEGSLFDGLPEYSVIMHQVNCLGIAGAGVALQVKNKFPKWYDDYHTYCSWFKGGSFAADRTQDLLGTFHQHKVSDKLIICSAFGQLGIAKDKPVTDYNAWKRIMRMVERQTRYVNEKMGMNWTVHIPHMMGCGLGGGDWDRMRELLGFYFGDSPVQLVIHKL